jgi:hypothetical protein
MSRNFDVLFRLEQDRELFRVPPVKKNPPGNGSGGNGKVSLPDPDGFAREEILRMVQYLFLGATNGNDQAGAQKEALSCAPRSLAAWRNKFSRTSASWMRTCVRSQTALCWIYLDLVAHLSQHSMIKRPLASALPIIFGSLREILCP